MLIYDEDCPLCSAYTKAFVYTGLLEEAGRKSFREVGIETLGLVDTKKCNNEIPLIDYNTKEVWYGIDALLEILDSKVPFIKFIGNITPVKWILTKAYKFISYNRKVIVARRAGAGYDCSPDFNARYRLVFLLCFLVFNSLMLYPLYAGVFNRSFIGGSSYMQVQFAHLIFVGVNISSALLLKKKLAYEYLGQVNMLALITVLLLVPLLLINNIFTTTGNWFTNSYLVLLTIFITSQYIHRMNYAGVLPHHHGLIAVNILSVLFFLTYLSR